MFGGGGGGTKVQANQMDPYTSMMLSGFQQNTSPYTSLPTDLKVPQPTFRLTEPKFIDVPQVLNPAQVLQTGLQLEQSYLDPVGLGITNTNPLFDENYAQDYRDKYFNYAISPGLQDSSIQQFMGGRLGNQGESSLSAVYQSNLENQGRQAAFFAAEDWKQMLVNQLLARRQSFFDQNVGLTQDQNNNAIQRAMGINSQEMQRVLGYNDQLLRFGDQEQRVTDQETSRLGMLNQFRLGTQGNYSSLLNGGMDRGLSAQTFNAQMEQQQAQSRTANLGNLAAGIFGVGGGLLNGFRSRSTPSFGGLGSSYGGYSSSPFSPTQIAQAGVGIGY